MSYSIVQASEQWSGFLGNLVIGVVGIVGALAGIFFERWMRRQGKIALHADAWKFEFRTSNAAGELMEVTPERALSATCSFRLDAYNARDDSTGLRVGLLIMRGANKIAAIELLDVTTARVAGRAFHLDAVDVLNLPPKEWVSLALEARFHVPDVDLKSLVGCDAYVVGNDPSGRETRRHLGRIGGGRGVGDS